MAQSFGLTLQDADKQYRNFAVKDRLSANTVVASTMIAEISDIKSEVVDDLTVTNTLTLSAFTQNSIPYIGADGLVSEDTTFAWDDTTKNLELGTYGVSIGASAGYATYSVAIGPSAGQTAQASQALAVGHLAGALSQGSQSIAIGSAAAQTGQSTGCVAIGVSAGALEQAVGAVALGGGAGQIYQGSYSVAIGPLAGSATQGATAVAIGNNTGNSDQGDSAVAIGNSAGQADQGANAIAIGKLAGQTAQFAGSICLNASGVAVSPTQAGFYVSPVRTQAVAANALTLAVSSGEIVINSSKTFVIDHPLKPTTHYLVHACLEGPEAGVYYRGQSVIPAGEKEITVALPEYVAALIKEETATVQLTALGHFEPLSVLKPGVQAGKFTVALKEKHNLHEDTAFYWQVTAKRQDVAVEVAKETAKKVGDGPYSYLV